MKRIFCVLSAIFSFASSAQAVMTEAQMCSIYFDTMSECTSARAKDTTGSTLTACTYTDGAGYHWCVVKLSGSLCAYSTSAACVSATTAVAGCTKDTSTGCYYPTSCKSGYYKNTELPLFVEGTDKAGVTCMQCPENGTCNGTSVTCNSGYTLTSTNPGSTLALRGTKWCVASSSGSGSGSNTGTDTPTADTISGSCPSGLSKSADGCCCIK